MISKNQVNIINIFTGKKMHRFLNVLTTFYKDIKRPVKRSERSDYENKKIHHIYSKI